MLNKKRAKKENKFDKGDAFVQEKTGSAPAVNLDGQWEHDFVDDNTPAGKTPEGQKNYKKNRRAGE